MSAAIVLDGWALLVDGGEPRVRDIDLAEKAGLKVPRDIRRTIRAALADGAISSGNNAVGGAHAVPTAWSEIESVPRPNGGGSQDVEVFYLNEEAAMIVLTRLRTPMAVATTRSLVVVCAAARRGELPRANAPAPQQPLALADPRPGIEAFLRVAAGLVAVMGPDWARTKIEHAAARLLGEEPEPVAPRLLTVDEYLRERGKTDAEVRSLRSPFGRVLKGAYKSRRGTEPPVTDRFIDGAMRPVCAYTEADRPLFDEAFALLAAPKLAGGSR